LLASVFYFGGRPAVAVAARAHSNRKAIATELSQKRQGVNRPVINIAVIWVARLRAGLSIVASRINRYGSSLLGR
jgi:hypothetical protein